MRLANQYAMSLIGAVPHDIVIAPRSMISLSKAHVVAPYVQRKELYIFKLREVNHFLEVRQKMCEIIRASDVKCV